MEINPDIIHANNLAFLTTYQSTKLSKKLKIKNVVHVRGVIGERGRVFNTIQRAYIKVLGYSIFKKADRLITLTKQDTGEIINLGCQPKKIDLVPNGVDVRKFHPSETVIPSSLLWCVGDSFNKKDCPS